MTKQKQFTIIMKGNRFGDYLSNTMDGYYTKWQVKYNYYPEYNEYKMVDCKLIENNIRKKEITDQLIQRTADWYNAIYMDCPEWVYQLKEVIQ